MVRCALEQGVMDQWIEDSGESLAGKKSASDSSLLYFGRASGQAGGTVAMTAVDSSCSSSAEYDTAFCKTGFWLSISSAFSSLSWLLSVSAR